MTDGKEPTGNTFNVMPVRSGQYAVFVLACSLSFAGTNATAQGAYELRCRGRGGAFSIQSRDSTTFSMRFAASTRAAGPTGGGLDPGTCSWIDRGINNAEPLEIHFSADSSKTALISERLRDPNNYWSFFVFNTNQGYFEAKSNNPWKSDQPTTAEITARNINPDLTTRGTNAEITPRKSVLDLAGKPAIEKQTYKNEDLNLPVVTDVTVVPTGQNVTISFNAFPNTTPLVELASAPPKRGADKRWSFPRVSGMVTRPAGGDRVNGRYSVDMNQELDPGETYYYIISARKDDSPGAARGQATGKFVTPGVAKSYELRYRGFYCYERANVVGSEEIYTIATVSFIDRSGHPNTLTELLPREIVRGVARNESHPDTGIVIYEGSPVNLLLTVILIHHEGGTPDGSWQYAKNASEIGFWRLLEDRPEMIFNPPTGSREVANALDTLGLLTGRSIHGAERVIGSISKIISASEMKEIADRGGPRPVTIPIGVPSDFFTEHRGYGAAYRVYFDIVPQ